MPGSFIGYLYLKIFNDKEDMSRGGGFADVGASA